MYVYKKIPVYTWEVWEVGYYDPKGKWNVENRYNSKDEAAERVHYLNGGSN